MDEVPPRESTPRGGFLLCQIVNPNLIPGFGILIGQPGKAPTFFVCNVFFV